MDPREDAEEFDTDETNAENFGEASHEENAFRISEEIFGRDFESNIVDDFEDLISRSEE
jgi:hypothetical protein